MNINIKNNYLILILSILLVTMIGCSDSELTTLLNSNNETISADEMNALKKVKELPKK